MYALKMMSGETYTITDDEAKALMLASKTKQMVVINSLKGTINTASISEIVPHDRIERVEGRLHDGSKVVKKFGSWVDAENHDVRLDYLYYPELKHDAVFSEEEWEEMKGKTKNERLDALLSQSKINYLRPISEILSEKLNQYI